MPTVPGRFRTAFRRSRNVSVEFLNGLGNIYVWHKYVRAIQVWPARRHAEYRERRPIKVLLIYCNYFRGMKGPAAVNNVLMAAGAGAEAGLIIDAAPQ